MPFTPQMADAIIDASAILDGMAEIEASGGGNDTTPVAVFRLLAKNPEALTGYADIDLIKTPQDAAALDAANVPDHFADRFTLTPITPDKPDQRTITMRLDDTEIEHHITWTRGRPDAALHTLHLDEDVQAARIGHGFGPTYFAETFEAREDADGWPTQASTFGTRTYTRTYLAEVTQTFRVSADDLTPEEVRTLLAWESGDQLSLSEVDEIICQFDADTEEVVSLDDRQLDIDRTA